MSVTEVDSSTRWDKVYPRLGTGPVPVGPCLDPDYYELERQRLFGQTWLYFGREEMLRKPGDFRKKRFEAANAEILVTRARDGQLRAFHNMCTHRGRALTEAETGNTRAFTCNFHGWTFDPNGTLVNLPGECQFFDFDRGQKGLLPVAIETWQGFIFVNFASPPRKSLDEYLGEFGEGLVGYPFGEMTANFRYTTTYKTNWKLTLDAFQEFYHVRTTHRRSLGPTVFGPKNENSMALTIELHPLHRVFSGWANPDYAPTPVELAAFRHGRSVAESFTVGKVPSDHLPRGVNPTRSTEWSFDVNVVFPNLIIDVLEGMYFTQEYWPLSVDTTYHEVNMYFRPPQNASELFARAHSAIELRDSILEDGSNIEPMQVALSKRRLSHLTLGDEEIACRHSMKVVDAFVYGDDPYREAADLVEKGEDL